jgi:hypothetical protein
VDRSKGGRSNASLVGCELSFRLSERSANATTPSIHHERKANEAVLVRAGHRTNALAFLAGWIEANCTDYLHICDPYFSAEDLELLRLVLASGRDLKVTILTSRKQQERTPTPALDEHYRNKWKQISDQSAPQTDIVVVGNRQGELPIHDRWWLTQGKGLRVGTSFNALGSQKESEISVLSDTEAQSCQREIDEYITMRKREHNGEKLSIYVFSL